MSTFTQYQVSAPRSWDAFEDLCHDLWRRIWNDPNTQKNGRRGQAQCGVDVYGRPDCGESYEGIQCKGKDRGYNSKLTLKELRAEVEKAKTFTPKITHFILATTAPNDASLQKEARLISEAHRKLGLFGVDVYGWDEVASRIDDYPELKDKHFPEIGPSVQSLVSTMALMNENQIAESVKSEQRHHEQYELLRSVAAALGIDGRGSEHGSNNPAEKILNEQIDQYRQLIKHHKYKIALDGLKNLKGHNWEIASDRTRFRLVTNIATALLGLGVTGEAIKLFLEAASYDPNDEKALCNIAFAHLLNGDLLQCKVSAEQAINVHPDSSRAYSLLLASIVDNDDVLDPELLVPEQLREASDVAYSLARIYIKKGDSQRGHEWMVRAYAKDKEDIEIRSGLAETILDIQFKDERITLGRSFSSEQQSQIEEACTLLEKVWEEIRSSDIPERFLPYLHNLVSAEMLLGKNDKALEIAEEVLRIFPSYKEMSRQVVVILVKDGKLDRALKILEQLDDNAFAEKLLMQADILAELNRIADALEKVESFLLNSTDPRLASSAKNLRIKLLMDSAGIDDALVEAIRLTDECPRDVLTLVQLANLERLKAHTDKAEMALQRAKLEADKNGGYPEYMAVAEAFFEQKRFGEAAKIYEKIISGSDSLSMQRLLLCLLETDHRRSALDVIKSLPQNDLDKPFYKKYLGVLQRRLGNLDEAIKHFKSYLENVPGDLQVWLGWVEASHRHGDIEAVASFLSTGQDFPEAKAPDLIQLSHLYHLYGNLTEALRLAYKTRRTFSNDPQAHLGYISLFLNLKDEGHFLNEIKEVASDTAFAVKRTDGVQEVFTIESELACNPDLGEIIPSHPLAVRSLGCKAGDTIVLDENQFGSRVGEIVWVKHKYLHVFHETLQGFEKKFPGSKGVCLAHIQDTGESEKDLEPILTAVSRRHSTVVKIEEMYVSHRLPVPVVAQLTGTHPVDTWAGMAARGAVKLKWCDGNHQERQHAFNLIEKFRGRFVVDATTFYNIYLLDVQDIVQEVVGKIGICQSSIDLLEKLVIERRFSETQGYNTLRKEGDGFVYHEIPPEVVKEAIVKIEKAIEWARVNCTILPAVPKADYDFQNIDINDYMDGSYYDTFLAADGIEGALLCDDQNLRLLGHSFFQINGVWLQPILMEALNSGILNSKRYADLIDTFIGANYTFITIDTGVLVSWAEKFDWESYPQFKQMASILGDPTCDLESSLEVAIGFLNHVWGRTLGDRKYANFFYAVLNIMLEHHWAQYDYIMNRIVFSMIASKDRKPRIQFLFKTIAGWCEGHFIKIPQAITEAIIKFEKSILH